MSMTTEQARDEMLTLFRTAWVAQASPPPLYYWDIAHDPPNANSWARVALRHSGGGNDAIGNKLFRRAGTVTVQLFNRFGEGLSELDALTKVSLDAFQGKSTPGGAWFRNVRSNEVGIDGEWFQVHVLADFEYTEVFA